MSTWPLCNRDPSSAPRWGGRSAPLCWRCCALSTGAIAGCLTSPALTLPICIGMLLPCFADGWAHYMHAWPSGNAIRILTGIPAGFALGSIVMSIQ